MIIQFREDTSAAHEQECIRRQLSHGQKVQFCSVFDNPSIFSKPKQLLSGVEKVILGSSDNLLLGAGHLNNDYQKAEFVIEQIGPLLRYIFAYDFPTLAFGFGHHLVGHFVGAGVELDTSQAETGTYDITLTTAGENDPLFAKIPQTFLGVQGHQDSLVTLPKGATLLARSERCLTQAVRYNSQIYTTQFQCDLDEKGLRHRLGLFPEYRDHPHFRLGEAHAPHGPLFLANFLKS